MTDIEIYRGNTVTMTLTLTNDDGSPYNLEGFVITSSLKEHLTDSVYILQNIATSPSPATGIAYVTLSHSDTLIPAKQYYWDILLSNGSTVIDTIEYGSITIIQTVTQ